VEAEVAWICDKAIKQRERPKSKVSWAPKRDGLINGLKRQKLGHDEETKKRTKDEREMEREGRKRKR
jgi:hypothetical protein